ncbi:TetR/AcrR family transcriptional regulator C-terminal domain-containing protein [Kitasatospora viridis]|uniref:TetR family transcriptional regulator n=1 Tax=Kitasatospora viridis TaxID=281105 RepID=A0A561UJ63_9ACTN|nr:TetR/AcrR family transcriptional regulator C-terminal domain-containing protein [Kitasatospora viridis]TWF99411.1 TetR family transcriptional regulator [Kitasatospora viridis]
MPLRRSDVLDGALELLDEVGLDELTTRRLADRLGVRAGALYWHYPSKSALLDALAGRIIGEMLVEPLAERDWAGRLRELCHRARDTMLAHRDGARLVVSFVELPPAAAAYFGSLTDTLRSAGATERNAALAADVLTSFVNGFTLEEQARQAHRLPRAERDAAFRLELDIVVGGIAAVLPPDGSQ